MRTIPLRTIPLGARRKDPFVFRTFLELGQEESASPFLNKRGKEVAKNYHLKISCLAALFLSVAYCIPHPATAEILLAFVYLIAGAPLLIQSIEDLFLEHDVNIDVLMTIAAFSAYFLGARFEGALLLVLFAISGSLEDLVTLKAKNALRHIHMIVPTKAHLLDSGNALREIAIEDIQVGQKIVVKAGDIVPLDARIIEGAAFVDLKHLTGESQPVRKKLHDEVVAGTKVQDAALTLEVLRTSQESAVQKLVELITKAEGSRPKLERWFDRLSRYYATSIIAVAFCSAIFFALQGLPLFEKEGAIYRSLAFLIAASPCALILAVPIAYLSALGSSARRGIVLKGGVVFDQLNRSTIVGFDKTGTLTLGALELDQMEPLGPSFFSHEEVLSAAASLERNATHPIAKAIYKTCNESNLFPVREIQVIPGVGVKGIVDIHGKAYRAFVGSPPLEEKVQVRQKEGKVCALFTLDGERGQSRYLFSFEDQPRPKIQAMLQRLKERGKRLFMLTGDNVEVARIIADKVGISEVYAGATPEEKLKKIQSLSRQFGLVMVGDGVNDAPALARASVGIAMGQMGSQITQDVADCILLNDNIELLDWLFLKAEKTQRIVRQNVAIATIAMVGASIPALLGYVPLWLAVILHEGGTVLVALNATRLLK